MLLLNMCLGLGVPVVSQLTPALSWLWAAEQPPTAAHSPIPGGTILANAQTHQRLINYEVTFKGCFPIMCSHSFCQKCVSGLDLDSELDFTSVGHKMCF